MKKLNDYDLEVLSERGIYDIDILDKGKQLIGLTVDTKRSQYYLIMPENKVIGKNVLDAYKTLEKEVIDKIAEKKYSGTLVGDTKTYTKEVLEGLFEKLGVYPISEAENKNNEELLENYKLYSNCQMEENTFNRYLYR